MLRQLAVFPTGRISVGLLQALGRECEECPLAFLVVPTWLTDREPGTILGPFLYGPQASKVEPVNQLSDQKQQ